MKLKLGSATLKPPLNPDPTQYKRSGDPPPRIVMADGTEIQITSEERTPFTVSMKGVAITNDGSGLSNAIKQSQVPSGPLTFTIESTSKTPPRQYRTVLLNGQPRLLEKEKASIGLPREWEIDMTKPNTAANPNRYYIGFDVRIDAGFQAPPTAYYFCILFQAWQGLGGHPPLLLNVLPDQPDGRATLRLSADSLSTEAIRADKEVYKFPVTKGDWHRYILMMQPNYEEQGGEGLIQLILDKIAMPVWKGDWGYKPGVPLFPPGTPNAGKPTNPAMWMSLGLYRMTQSKKQSVSVKEIKFGKQLSDVE